MRRETWARVLVSTGLLGMLIAAADPLEGSVVILPAALLAGAGAHLGHARRRLLYRGIAVMALGIAAMFALSAIGGVGGSTSRSMWWALLVLPYPVGWLIAVVAAALAILEWMRRRAGAPTAD